jgi:glycosyltransferase involved in cell wall biosynthesis
MVEAPLISIITPSFNRASMIEIAIQSVAMQPYPRVEHIIIDGGSTDGTLELLKKYPHLRIISEPDRGVYDALNKGIALANGEIIGHLNTDDFYEPNIFAEVAEAFLKNPGIVAVSGGARVIGRNHTGKETLVASYPPIREHDMFFRLTVGVPIFNAWFFKKNIFKEIGFYNPVYLLAADRDFLLRFAVEAKKFAPLDKIIYNYVQHPASLTLSQSRKQRIKYVLEAILITDTWLKSNLEREVLPIFQDWKAYLYGELLVVALVTHNLTLMRQALVEGRIFFPWRLGKYLRIRLNRNKGQNE